MPQTPATTALYTASEVESRTGIPATTLRQWERRYGFPSPSRTAGGYRMYSPLDLACIGFIQARQDEGIAVSRAVALAREHFAEPPAPDLPLVEELIRALLLPDHREAARLLGQAHASFSAEEIMMNVMRPTLVQIGQMWERGEITVAHEHQASAFLKVRLSQMLDAAGLSDFGPSVVAACGPGEHHEIGLMMLAVTLRRRGVRVHYLGSNMPLADMAVYTRAVDAQALLISLNTQDSLDQFRAQLSDFALLREPLYLGGQMLNMNPALAQELGGQYLGDSATAAADTLVRLLGSQTSPPQTPLLQNLRPQPSPLQPALADAAWPLLPVSGESAPPVQVKKGQTEPDGPAPGREEVRP